MKNIITRAYNPTDNKKQIIDLIIETDDYIYPPMFTSDENERYSFFADCMNDENSIFYHGNMYVAECEGDIVGLLVIFCGGKRWRLASPEIIGKYQNREAIAYCEEHYFAPLVAEYENRENIYYFSNVCVHENFRGVGIADKMMKYFLGGIDVTAELDVLCDNPPALRLYQSNGFEILYSEPAFAFEHVEGLRSYKMRRNP